MVTRETLGLVGVEQRLLGRPPQLEVELPHQIVGVAQAGAEPLPDERRGLVRGIASRRTRPARQVRAALARYV